MFWFPTKGARLLVAASTLALGAVAVQAQSSSSSSSSSAQDAPQTAPAPAPPVQRPPFNPAQRSRRVNANRQARIARNIQDEYSHAWEIGGGGGYLRWHPGPTLYRINEINFWMNAARMFSPRFGVLADVRGNYGNANIRTELAQNFIFKPQISHYNFMGGVVYRIIGKEKYTVGVQGEGGVTLSKFGGDAKGQPSQNIGLWKDSNYNPTFSGSVNLDYNLYNNFAARVQPTYVATTFGSTVQNSFGVNVGLVYRFGRQ